MKEVFWIKPLHAEIEVPLAIVLRPRGDDWLNDALIGMKREGIQTVSSMLENWEAESLGLKFERSAAEQVGITFLNYPIPDRETPTDVNAFGRFVDGLANRLREGERIGIHCRGSIGRATIAAACALIHLGWKPAAALAAIEETRGCQVPDTEEQRDWIMRYEVRA